MSLTPDELGKKIKDANDRQGLNPSDLDKAVENVESKTSASSRALRTGTDLVSAVLVGGFLGYWIDKWIGTKPLVMIVMLFLGFAAGFLNIYRSQTGQDYKVGFKKDQKEGKE